MATDGEDISNPPSTSTSTIGDLKDEEIVELLKNTTTLSLRMNLLQLIMRKHGPAFCVNDVAVRDCIEEVYAHASYVHNWSVVRQGAGLLEKTVDSLAPSIMTMLVAGKQVKRNLFSKLLRLDIRERFCF